MRRALADLPNPATWQELVEKYVKLTGDLGLEMIESTDNEAIRRYNELFSRPIAKRPPLIVPEDVATILACVPYARHLGALLLPDTSDARTFVATLQPPELYIVDGCETSTYEQKINTIPHDYVDIALSFSELAQRDHESRVRPLIQDQSSAAVSASLFSEMRPSAYVVAASVSQAECRAAALASNYAAALGSPLLLFDDDELFSSEIRACTSSVLSGTRCFRKPDGTSRDLVPKEELDFPSIVSESTAELAHFIERVDPMYVGVVSTRVTIPLELIGDPPLATKYAFGRLVAPDLTSLALLISAAALREEVRRDPNVRVVIADAANAVEGRLLPGARSEADHLSAVLSTSKDLLVTQISGENDLTRFLDASRTANIIHFSGHGAYDNDNPVESGLIFCEGKLQGTNIPSALKGNPIVFSNACESGVVYGTEDVCRGWSGLAAAFIESGAVNYIGSLWPIFDESSRRFAEKFYSLLNGGYSTGEALRRVKFDAFRAGDPTWAAMVLFGCPRNRLRSGGQGIG
jgi:hypothetical protein